MRNACRRDVITCALGPETPTHLGTIPQRPMKPQAPFKTGHHTVWTRSAL